MGVASQPREPTACRVRQPGTFSNETHHMAKKTNRWQPVRNSLSFAWLALLRKDSGRPTVTRGTHAANKPRRDEGAQHQRRRRSEPAVRAASEAQEIATARRRDEILSSAAARRCPDLAKELAKTSLPAAEVVALLQPHAAELEIVEAWDRAFASVRRS
jgi:hypothetical protein